MAPPRLWGVIGVVVLVVCPAITLHRLHWWHWEVAASHSTSHDHLDRSGCNTPANTRSSNASLDVSKAESVICPVCPTCPPPSGGSLMKQAGNLAHASSALGQDLGSRHLRQQRPLVMLTFGNSAVWPMLQNWAANVKKAGLGGSMLIGALDEGLAVKCRSAGFPVEQLDGKKAGMTSGAYLTKSNEDLRKYKLMASLKIGFALDLLKRQTQNVLISDSDTAWLRDPRPFFEEGPFQAADVLVSTDCIDTVADEICHAHYCGCHHVAFNTGIVFLRHSQATIKFVEAWKAKVLEDAELTIRDQAAFNIVIREGMEPRRVVPGYENYPRQTLYAYNGQLKMGILPLLFFQNGHTYFTQKLHERRNIVPYVVHATYQYGDGALFPFGKRQRMREAGLWMMDPPEYYSGNFLAISWAGATRPEFRVTLDIDSRISTKYHLEEDKYRRQTVRNALAIASLLNRTLIMPRMLCYVDHMWKEMRAGRFAGAYSMSLPFDCPMDYLFELPRFFENAHPILRFREPEFLNRLPSDLERSRQFVHVVPKNERLDDKEKFPRFVTRNDRTVAASTVQEGMKDVDVVAQLKKYDNVRVLELSSAVTAFCGFDSDKKNKEFDDIMRHPLRKKWEFKYMETGMEGQPSYKYWVSYDKFEWMNGFDDVVELGSPENRNRRECHA